jgi:hypothetical protein
MPSNMKVLTDKKITKLIIQIIDKKIKYHATRKIKK